MDNYMYLSTCALINLEQEKRWNKKVSFLVFLVGFGLSMDLPEVILEEWILNGTVAKVALVFLQRALE